MEPSLIVYLSVALSGAFVLLVVTAATPVRYSISAFYRSHIFSVGVLGISLLLYWPGVSSEAYRQGDSLGILRVLRVIAFLGLFGWCSLILIKFRNWPSRSRLNWYVLYAAACLVSVTYSPNPVESTWKSFELVVLILFAWSVRRQMQNGALTSGDIVDVFSYLNFSICVFSIVGWLLFPGIAHGIVEDGVELNRDSVWGIFPRVNPNMLSQIGAMTAYVGFVSSLVGRRVGLRDLLYFVIGGTVLILAHSRTSFMALVIAMTFTPILIGNKKALLTIVASLVVAVFVAGGVLLEFLARGQSQEQLLSLTGRIYMWTVAWNAFLSDPWLGKGFYAGHKTLSMDGLGMTYSSVDNTYLESLVNVGVVGTFFLIVFVLITIAGCVRLVRLCKSRGGQNIFAPVLVTGFMVIMFLRSIGGPSFQILHPNALLILMIVLIVENDTYEIVLQKKSV